MVLVSALVAIYYNVIIAWAFWYLFDSLRGTLPYQKCGEWSSICKFSNILTKFLSRPTAYNATLLFMQCLMSFRAKRIVNNVLVSFFRLESETVTVLENYKLD